MASSPQPWLRLRLLGGCEFQRAERKVRLETAKSSALFAYLALQRSPQPRHKLMGLLWGNLPEPSARSNLRHALWHLRSKFDPPDCSPLILTDQQTVAFNHQANYWLDVEEFEKQRRRESELTADTLRADNRYAFLREAMDLYRGDLLEGLYVGDAPAFEEWLLIERVRLRALAVESLQRLVAFYIGWGEYDTGLDYARRLLAMEPWMEETHRQTMRLLALTGQRSAALEQYETCRRILAEELNAEPSRETQALSESIRVSAAEICQPRAAAPPRNLPPQATPFVGREEELAKIAALLRNPSCRLLSLVGPGGMGKTRLAVRAAADAEDFGDGIFFVPLAGVGSPNLLVSAMADAIGLTFRGGESTHDQLLNYLRDKEMLLLIDNLEHLLEGTGLLEEILHVAPAVKLLATSRERLHLFEEWLFEVAGLAYPHPLTSSPDEVQSGEGAGGRGTEVRYSAVQLFIQSTRRLDVALSEEDKSYAARFCQMVEGMPLAIELTAAWTRTLACQEIAQRLEHSLDLLTTSLRDLPPRHRSMRAVFDSSWQMLTEDERAAFKRLSVFRGGFSKPAAETIAGADFTLLASLVDKSFVRHNLSGRYEIHELLRQFGEEKLSGDESVQARRRHSHYFSEFLQQRTEGLRRSRTKETLDEVAEEIQNVRAAWNWATERREVEEIAASYESLYRFYELRSLFQEGEVALEQAAQALTAAADGTRDCALRAGVLWRQARFCQRLALFDKARMLLDESLDISQRNRMRREAGYSLKESGILGLLRGEHTQAQQDFLEALAVFRAVGDELDVCAALVNLGYAACQMGQYEDAGRWLEEALAISRKLGAPEAIGFALCYLGLVSRGLGNPPQAKQRFQQALASYREIGHAWGMALCLHVLAKLATEAGEYDEATRLAEEGLAHAKKIGDPNSTSLCLNRLGEIAGARQDYDAAKRYHLQALEMAWKAKQPPLVLEGLIGLAVLESRTARADTAYELLTLVVHHPATVASERDRAARLITKLESQLAPEVIAAATEKAETEKLEEAVEKILAGR